MIRADKPYVLDSNILIQAERTYYDFAFCPAFWDSLLGHHEAGNVGSIDHVKQEILRGQGELADWTRNSAPPGFFQSTRDANVLALYRQIIDWVQESTQFFEAAKTEFARGADGWLVAYAASNNWIVVTHEELAPQVKVKVPIPNVCMEFGVSYANTFEMLRALRVEYTWAAPS